MCHRSFRVLEFPNVSYDPHGNKLQRKKYTTIVSNSSEDSVKKKKKMIGQRFDTVVLSK